LKVSHGSEACGREQQHQLFGEHCARRLVEYERELTKTQSKLQQEAEYFDRCMKQTQSQLIEFAALLGTELS